MGTDWGGKSWSLKDQGGDCLLQRYRWEMTTDRTMVETVAWGKVAHSGYILRVEPTGFSDRLEIKIRERGVEDDAMIFALQLEGWKCH